MGDVGFKKRIRRVFLLVALQTKCLHLAVSPEVAAFFVVMEGRFRLEGLDDADKWTNFTIGKLVRELQRRAGRLTDAVDRTPSASSTAQ